MNTEAVRQRILRTMNFIHREFTQGFHFIVGADNAKSSACISGAVAYVWRASRRLTTGYQETTAPKCRSSDNPRTKNCGLDENGKHYVYLCNVYMQQSERYQIGVLVHEAAHHAGPNDVTGSLDQMKRQTQHNQVMNAANYENFAKSVVSGGCEDTDGNCPSYGAYCNHEHIKASCKRTCGLCSSSGCEDTDGNCPSYGAYCNHEHIKASCKRTC